MELKRQPDLIITLDYDEWQEAESFMESADKLCEDLDKLPENSLIEVEEDNLDFLDNLKESIDKVQKSLSRHKIVNNGNM